MAEGASVPATRREPDAPRSVLVVDDDPDSADALAILLEQWSHRVRVAYSGAQAVEIFRNEHPDIVVIDIGLPDIDGYEVARALKREGTRALLVALTGFGDERDRVAAAEAGFDRHFVKPIDIQSLREVLARG